MSSRTQVRDLKISPAVEMTPVLYNFLTVNKTNFPRRSVSSVDFRSQLFCSGLGWPVYLQYLEIVRDPRFVMKDLVR